MSDEKNNISEADVIILASKILEIERETRSDGSGNRNMAVAKILSLLNEETKDDNK